MPTMIPATMIRPVTVDGPTGQLAGIEIVSKNGDQYVAILSGEGMKGLIQDIQQFLADNPQIAAGRSQDRQ